MVGWRGRTGATLGMMRQTTQGTSDRSRRRVRSDRSRRWIRSDRIRRRVRSNWIRSRV